MRYASTIISCEPFIPDSYHGTLLNTLSIQKSPTSNKIHDDNKLKQNFQISKHNLISQS